MLKGSLSPVGFISKPHGKNGEINIQLKAYDSENIEAGETLFIETDGFLVPFSILEITPKGNTAVVLLDFISTPQEAERFNGKKIYIKKTSSSPKTKESHIDPSNLTGFFFEDINTRINGEVLQYIDNPLNPLLLIRTSDNEFLVPFQEGIIMSIDKINKTIIANLPEGLTEL